MEKIRFGNTDLFVTRAAFGGIPIQRLNFGDAVGVVRGCINLGVNFIDTANGYTDSEEKIGAAIKGMPRDGLVIATKSGARDKKTFLEHVDLSLKRLGTDYIDIYQLHGLSADAYEAVLDEDGAYAGLKVAIRAGKVRYPAFSAHNITGAIDVMKGGKFAAVQLPINYVDDEAAKEAIPLAKKLGVGFIAMKPFGGGLLSDAYLSIKYLMQFDSVVPDPGIEKVSEMEEIVRIYASGARFTEEDAAAILKAKTEMGTYWCHRCDYCRPCPQDIAISTALNIESFIKRMPAGRVAKMAGRCFENARTCTGCRACVAKCPYDLDIPALLKERIKTWDRFIAEAQL